MLVDEYFVQPACMCQEVASGNLILSSITHKQPSTLARQRSLSEPGMGAGSPISSMPGRISKPFIFGRINSPVTLTMGNLHFFTSKPINTSYSNTVTFKNISYSGGRITKLFSHSKTIICFLV